MPGNFLQWRSSFSRALRASAWPKYLTFREVIEELRAVRAPLIDTQNHFSDNTQLFKRGEDIGRSRIRMDLPVSEFSADDDEDTELFQIS